MSLRQIFEHIVSHPLNRHAPVSALMRFASWQVRSRFSPDETIFQFVNDSRLYARRGMTGATGNLYTGMDEFQDMALLLHFLRPDDLFVDVGSNIGSYTVLAAKCAGARVMAFEPGETTRRWLQRNIELNEITNLVEVKSQAVGSKIGVAGFTEGLESTNHLIMRDQELTPSGTTVELTTLDAVLSGRDPAMIKIDVEGFETEVLRGGPQTFANPSLQCVLMELGGAGAEYGYDEDGLRRQMIEYGFTVCYYDPFTRQFQDRPAAQVEPQNTLFVRDVRYVADRLKSAKAFQVLGQTI